MVVSAATLILVSYGVKYLFESGKVPAKYDFLRCNLANGGRTIKLKVDDESKINAFENSDAHMSEDAFEKKIEAEFGMNLHEGQGNPSFETEIERTKL